MSGSDRPKRSRKSAEERRVEIARAALDLLGDVPVAELSTRRVARHVGVTQPALFKHFRSRESILLAVLSLVRSELQGLIHAELAQALPPRQALGSLLSSFGDFVQQRPGVPRLLFHELSRQRTEAGKKPGPLAAPLRHLGSMQRALLGEFVRLARQRQELPAELDVEAAAEQLLAGIRGYILAWQFAESTRPLRELFLRALDEAWAAWEQGVPCGEGGESEEPSEELQTLLRLDARPLIGRGEDPLEEVLRLLHLLAPTGAVQLLAPFRPTPLITLLESRGFLVTVSELGKGDWELILRGEAAPEILDYRDLAAPEPLNRVLLARAQLRPGEVLLARLPRRPELLLQRLSEFGDLWNALLLDDGSCLLHLTVQES
ncbi:MAG: hypothetical protein CSA62_07560 [Planctomycetota bacterium]|nr:MAG: hypothetical protein CSA62_07560 [Planctomycetota bacterium]